MKIVFAGNCQAYALCFLYERHIGRQHGQTVGWVDAWNERRLEDWKRELSDADLVVSQLFSGQPRVPIDDLCGDAARIVFPDVRGGFLWPYGNVARIDNPCPPYKGGGPYDPEVGDSYLNGLIRTGVSTAEALERYTQLDVPREVHLDRLFELTLDQQRRRDDLTGFRLADQLERRFRAERLFTTQGHLSVGLFHLLATEVYGRIGVDGHLIGDMLRQVRAAPFEPYHDAPIHPAVAAHYGLAYADEQSQYHHVQEGRFSFAERVVRYMDNAWSPELHEGCAAALEEDWPRALHLLERGLVRAPGSAHGHSRKSYVLQRLGRLTEAAEAAELAVRMEPDDEQFAERLARARDGTGLPAQLS